MTPLTSANENDVTIDTLPFELSTIEKGVFKLNINGDIVKSTFFPLSSLGYSFSKDLAYLIGEALGKEGLALNAVPLLIDSFNEYSEEEFLSARLISYLIKGIESIGIADVVKVPLSFKDSPFENVFLEKRTLFERFIKPFEILLRECSPDVVVCTSNAVNESTEDYQKIIINLLNKGYDGLVSAPIEGITREDTAFLRGIDLIIRKNTAKISHNAPRQKIEALLSKISLSPRPCDMEGHKELASRLARESIVMLENKGVFPFKKGCEITLVRGKSSETEEKLAQYLIESGFKAIIVSERELTYPFDKDKSVVLFADIKGKEKIINSLLEKSIKVTAIAFKEVYPLHKKLDGVLYCNDDEELFFKGIVSIISGKESPSGRLAYTIAIDSGKALKRNLLKEGVFSGYKMYDKLKEQVLYPLGYGLSYASFTYKSIECNPLSSYEDGDINITVSVKNESDIKGKHTLLLFVKPPNTRLSKPLKKLFDFDKIELLPHQERKVRFKLKVKDLAYYNSEKECFCVETGIYKLLFLDENGKELLCKGIQIFSDKALPLPSEKLPSYSDNLKSSLSLSDEAFKAICLKGVNAEIENYPLNALKGGKGNNIYRKIRKLFEEFSNENPQFNITKVDDLPLRLLVSLDNVPLLNEAVDLIKN